MNIVLPAVVAFLGMALTAAAQTSREDLEKRLQAKLDSEFLKKADWQTDYAAAREQSRKSGKLIFAYFTRSYAP